MGGAAVLQVMGEQGVLEPAQGRLMETPDSTSINSLITQIPPPSTTQFQDMERGDTETLCGGLVYYSCAPLGDRWCRCALTP